MSNQVHGSTIFNEPTRTFNAMISHLPREDQDELMAAQRSSDPQALPAVAKCVLDKSLLLKSGPAAHAAASALFEAMGAMRAPDANSGMRRLIEAKAKALDYHNHVNPTTRQ